MDYSQILSQQFNIKEEYAKNIITLLDDGNTIPFIGMSGIGLLGSLAHYSFYCTIQKGNARFNG